MFFPCSIKPAQHLVECRCQIFPCFVFVTWLTALISHPLDKLAAIVSCQSCNDALVKGLHVAGHIRRQGHYLDNIKLDVGQIKHPAPMLKHLFSPRYDVRGRVVYDKHSFSTLPAKLLAVGLRPEAI
jgi:hypothetical protein